MNSAQKVSVIFGISLVASALAAAFTIETIRTTRDNITKLALIAQMRAEHVAESSLFEQHLIETTPEIRKQWSTANATLDRTLNNSLDVFNDSDTRPLVHELIKKNRELLSKTTQFFESAPDESQTAHAALGKELILIQNRIFTTTTELGTIFKDQISHTQKKLAFGVGAILAILTGVIALNLTWTRSLLQELKDANDKLLRKNQKIQNDKKKQEADNQQLRNATQNLEVSEQKLKEQLEELSRFKKLTVDRELAMIELKKKLKTSLNEHN